MKLQPEDPRLTAFLLGELSADDAAAVERAIAADPALQIAIRELENLQSLLTGTLSANPQTLLPRQRDTIRRAARQADHSDKPVRLSSHRASLKPLLIPFAVAAAIAMGIYVLVLIPAKPSGGTARQNAKPPSGEIPMEIALLPAPGPVDASSSARPAHPAASGDTGASGSVSSYEPIGEDFLETVQRRLENAPPPAVELLPSLRARKSVSASHHPTLALPIQSGRASLGWISHSIRENHEFPPANAVRLEEILNHFILRPTGATAISQGVSLSTETLPCPWKPSATLAIISIRGAAQDAKNITATYQAETGSVWRYRLLGYATVEGAPGGNLPRRLPAGAVTTIALEIEPGSSAREFGSIEWTVDEKPAASVPVARREGHEPSDDARFAALLCAFSQWLAAESSALIDAEMVAALAREVATDTLPADRADLIHLIDQALRLER